MYIYIYTPISVGVMSSFHDPLGLQHAIAFSCLAWRDKSPGRLAGRWTFCLKASLFLGPAVIITFLSSHPAEVHTYTDKTHGPVRISMERLPPTAVANDRQATHIQPRGAMETTNHGEKAGTNKTYQRAHCKMQQNAKCSAKCRQGPECDEG